MSHVPMHRVHALWFALVVLLAPHAARADLRPGDLAAINHRADAQIAELEGHPCDVRSAPTAEDREFAARNLRLAMYDDFIARNLPVKRTTDRAKKSYSLVFRAGQSYERAYSCTPGFEHRGVLQSAIDLLDHAIADLKQHPATEVETMIADLESFRAKLDHAMPRPPRQPPCPRPTACASEAPAPSGAGRRGCAIDADSPEGPDALMLLALWICATRPRRRARASPSKVHPALRPPRARSPGPRAPA